MVLTNAQLQEILDGRAHACIWGWADYDDVFRRRRRHRTEFCNEVRVVGGSAATGWTIAMIVHDRFNGMDEECMRHPTPFHE